MDVDSIKFSVSQIEFFNDGARVFQLDYARFSYQQVQDIKSVISYVADENNITVN
jgi:hypothetical protein